MEFVLVVALAVAISGVQWWRSRRTYREIIFHGVTRTYARFWHRWWCRQADPLPVKGPLLVISNHTCSSDPVFLQTASWRVISWLASKEHYEGHPLIRKLLDTLHCVPVRRNGQDAMAARIALRRLQNGRAVCLFPEGNLSGVAKGRLRHAKAGAAWLALRSDAMVIPAWISGGPQSHRLLASWVYPTRRGVRVVFGMPVDMSRFRGQPITRELVEHVSAYLMKAIERLGQPMSATTDLTQRRCVPCESGVPRLSADQIHKLLPGVPGWQLTDDGQRLRREWRVKDFLVALDFFQRVGQIAEQEDHHPDLHLVGYRNVAIEIWTHALGGLSENDFILAAKIGQLPVELKS